jgi:signal transduction histidine kinase
VAGGKDNPDPIKWEQACFQVQAIVGRITAGVSHEIKNKLAVLLEQGSLLQELAQAASAKGSMDPARVEGLARRFIKKIWETDEVVKKMNRFAHGADKADGCLEARETLRLMIALHRRAAEMKPVAVLAEENEKSVNVETRPMFLLALLYACLESAAQGARQGSEIRTAVVENGSEVRFEFYWDEPGEVIPPSCPEVLEALAARVESLEGRLGLALVVPAAFRCGAPWDRDKVLRKV